MAEVSMRSTTISPTTHTGSFAINSDREVMLMKAQLIKSISPLNSDTPSNAQFQRPLTNRKLNVAEKFGNAQRAKTHNVFGKTYDISPKGPQASPEVLGFIQRINPRAQNGNPLSFLGIERGTSTETIKDSYRKMRQKFLPHKFDNPAERRLAAMSLAVIEEAFEVYRPRI